jgi:hypothetical protein
LIFSKSRAVASAGRGGASLDELTQKLFNFVKETQIQAHTNPRYIGSWHVSVSFRGIAACVQTDSFFPTKEPLPLPSLKLFDFLSVGFSSTSDFFVSNDLDSLTLSSFDY